MPGDPGVTVVTNACAFYTTHAAAGASSVSEGRTLLAKLAAIGRRDREAVSANGGCLKSWLREVRWRRMHHIIDVPAKAGTHTPRPRVFGTVTNDLCSNQHLWLWVPSFAGTTLSIRGHVARNDSPGARPHDQNGGRPRTWRELSLWRAFSRVVKKYSSRSRLNFS
jgi:hypothetical protein